MWRVFVERDEAEVDGFLIRRDELVPNPRNPKQHPQSQVTLLAKVIGHQGWRSPIVVSTRSGFIVAGQGRYEAAKALISELKATDLDMEFTGFDAGALEGLMTGNGEPEPPDDFPAVDENVPTEFQCPKCSFRWSGKPS